MERWSWTTAFMSAVTPRLVCKSTLAPRFSSSLTISRWSLDAAACSRVDVEGRPSQVVLEQRASTSPPLRSHLTTVCSLPCWAEEKISTGSEAGELTAGSSATGGAAGAAPAGGGGAVCCRMSSEIVGGAAVLVEQLGVGLGSQQGLHARLSPVESGRHQGGSSHVGLQVGFGRVLQQDEQDVEVAVARSIIERGDAKAGLQVDGSPSLQQHSHHLQVVVACGGVQQGGCCRPTVFSSEAGELSAGSQASGGAAGAAAAGCGGAACCRMSFVMLEWPWPSATRRAVLPFLVRSSALAPARSRACTHVACPGKRPSSGRCSRRGPAGQIWPNAAAGQARWRGSRGTQHS
eukprot:scaffold4254_cov60-Phaeocystis_antarctica.AAC.2